MNSAQELIAESFRLFAPPPKQTVCEWAIENFYVSTGAEKGEFRPKSFQIEPLNTLSDPRVNTTVIMSATQMLKTLSLLIGIGYAIARDPDPIMFVAPHDSDVNKFSKFRLAPMLRDTPALKEKVADSRSRNSLSTIDVKDFPGGPLILTASASPGNLASFTIRYLFCDEIDKYPASAGSEGDPISLAIKRTAHFRSRRKIMLSCSPTVGGSSRIETAYNESDQREFYVSCPACGEAQTLRWARVKWNNKLPKERQAETAKYQCERCEALWNDSQRWKAVNGGRWIASMPFSGTAGFKISELYSPWKTLGDIVKDFLAKKDDPQQLKTFINTSLCEPWQEKGEAPEWRRLYDRRESYQVGIVPRGGLFLTGFVDVQADRLEVEFKAWGRNGESWSIWYEVIQPLRPSPITGSMEPIRPSEPEPWKRLDELIKMNWPHIDGANLKVLVVGIDTGHMADTVYAFCKRYPQPAHGPAGSIVTTPHTVVPTKGNDDDRKLIAGVSTIDAAKKRGGLRIITIGTHFAKQQVYTALRAESPVDGQPAAPGYCHFPDYSSDFFKGLTAETMIRRKNGVEWRKDGRNEPLDLHVGNLAAMALCGALDMPPEVWDSLEAHVKPKDPDAPPSVLTAHQRQVIRSSFMGQ